MSGKSLRWPPAVALFASLVGLTFGWLSTQDYVRHLDRQTHDIHCSYIPGAIEEGADNPCVAALFSPFSAIFRDQFWGGIPISLFAVGAFSFFAAFALYALMAGRTAPRRTAQFLALAGLTPLFVSVLMATISALILKEFCKTCVGIYVSSTLLAIASVAYYVMDRKDARTEAGLVRTPGPTSGVPPTVVDGESVPTKRRMGGWALVPAWLVTLGLFAMVPAILYVSALPDYTSHITSCGTLEKPAEKGGAYLHIAAPGAEQPATLFVDPLCPTCKALHQRLEADGYLEKLDMKVVLFPLDAECNWMTQRSVHPGACAVSRAILCSDKKALAVLEWAYEEQESILELAKSDGGAEKVESRIVKRFPDVKECLGGAEVKKRLDDMLRFIVDNKLPVSTPQIYLDDRRLCAEDSDIGLAFALQTLAPSLKE